MRICSSWLLGCVCFKINAFPIDFTRMLALAIVLLATRFLVVAGVRLLQNQFIVQWFCKHLSLWLLLATIFIVVAWDAFASSSMYFPFVLQAFGSRYGCCLRLCSSWLLVCACFKPKASPMVLQTSWP